MTQLTFFTSVGFLTNWSDSGAFYEDIPFLEGSLNKEGINEMEDPCCLSSVVVIEQHIHHIVLSSVLRMVSKDVNFSAHHEPGFKTTSHTSLRTSIFILRTVSNPLKGILLELKLVFSPLKQQALCFCVLHFCKFKF